MGRIAVAVRMIFAISALILLLNGCEDIAFRTLLEDMAEEADLSDANAITSFVFIAGDNAALSADATGTINGTAITATVPYGTDVTALVASFGTTGVSVAVGGTTQVSGVTANNFINPVTYAVEATDGSIRSYIVTVTIASASYSFALDVATDGTGSGSIDTDNSTANGSYDAGTSVTSQATADSGSFFVGWYDAASGGSQVSTANPYIFTLNADTTLYAKFVIFNMNYCPGGTFPTEVDDSGEDTVNAFWIAETEVSYELWYAVRDWAENGTDGAVGEGQYSFANAGCEGHDGTVGASPTIAQTEPVTAINWRDAMVWCNALTEYYNAQNGTSLGCVYKDSGTPIRDSRDTNATQCDGVTPDSNAKGFRLPEHPEWECAARWKGSDGSYGAIERPVSSGIYWTPGDYASGATADYTNTTETNAVAVYGTTSTAEGKSKTANDLGLYDMSGNVWEWSFTLVVSDRVFLGGSWLYSAGYLRVGFGNYSGSSSGGDIDIGFRPVRTAE